MTADSDRVDRLLGNVAELWAVPANTRKLQRALSEPETPLDEVVRDIERDPGLAAQCLRMVNSAREGMSVKITSVRRAVAMLGYSATRRIVTCAALITKLGRPKVDRRVSLRSFWIHSLWTAHAAAWAAGRAGVRDVDDLFAAGLLHDVGKLVLWRYLPAETARILDRTDRGAPADEAERLELGVGHAAIGAAVCRRWGFPEEFVRAVALHLEGTEALAAGGVPDLARRVAAACALERRAPDHEARWTSLTGLDGTTAAEAREEAGRKVQATLQDLLAFA